MVENGQANWVQEGTSQKAAKVGGPARQEMVVVQCSDEDHGTALSTTRDPEQGRNRSMIQPHRNNRNIPNS